MSRAVGLLVVSYLIVAVALGVAIDRTRDVASSTNEIVKVQLVQKEKTIQAQQYVIEQQAVPAITYMAQLLEESGIRPPQVLLNPNGPPFTPPE